MTTGLAGGRDSQKLYTESYPFFQTEALYLLIFNLIMEIDFIQELKKRDELLDGYLRQIEIQEEFIQKQKELIEYLEDHISKITDIVSSV